MIWWYWVNCSVPAGVGIGTFIVSNQTGHVSQTVCGTPSYSRSTARARSAGRSSLRRDATLGLATGSTRSPKSFVAPCPAMFGGQYRIATSMPSRSRSWSRFSATSRTCTPGWAVWKPASLGTNQSDANVTVVLTVTDAERPADRTDAVAAHGLQIALACVGKQQRPGAAVEELRPELLLERLHLPADRRLGEEELLARLGEGQMPRGGLEPLEEVERRQVAGRHLHSSAACMGYRQVVCPPARPARSFAGTRAGGRRRRCMQTAHYREQRDEHQGRHRPTRPAALGHADARRRAGCPGPLPGGRALDHPRRRPQRPRARRRRLFPGGPGRRRRHAGHPRSAARHRIARRGRSAAPVGCPGPRLTKFRHVGPGRLRACRARDASRRFARLCHWHVYVRT